MPASRWNPLLYLPEVWFDELPTTRVKGNVVGYERDATSQRVLLEWEGRLFITA